MGGIPDETLLDHVSGASGYRVTPDGETELDARLLQ